MSDFVPETEENEEEMEQVQENSKATDVQNASAPEFTRRFLNDKWYGKYGENGALLEHIGENWVPVDPEMEELLSQLWFEQEESERKSHANFDWDPVKNEWVPKTGENPTEPTVNDDFIAHYQANYGVQYEDIYKKMDEEIQKKTTLALEEEEKKKEKKKKRKLGLGGEKEKEEGWVDRSDKVFAVYVSKLPKTLTEEEFSEFMAKCGVIQPDFRTNKPKCKLYRDEHGELKGDGRCCYIKKESVDLALNILDGAQLHGQNIRVEEAHFEMKGDFDPTKKRKRLTEAQKKRYREQQNKIFEWVPDKPRNYRPKSDLTVIVKNLFTPEQMLQNAALMLDLKEEMTESCAKYGTVKKVVVYDNHPDGIVSVSFTNTEESDQAVKYLNGRVVDGRKLTAELWDGKTKFKVEETEEDAERRHAEFEKFIGGGSEEHQDSDQDQ